MSDLTERLRYPEWTTDLSGWPEMILDPEKVLATNREAADEIERLQVLLRAAGVREWIITADRTPTQG